MFTLPSISKKKGVPLYISLYEGIKESIITHELEPEEKLPSKRTLAELLGISLKTVENAYEQLLLEGYIYAVEKSGYYVENLHHYKKKDGANVTFLKSEEPPQPNYKVNLRVNRNAKEDFPENLWCHLIRETMLEDRGRLFEEVPVKGIYELRKEIALHLRETRGMEVSPHQIVVGAGTAYLYSRLRQTLGEDKLFGLPDPASRRLHEMYRINGMKWQVIETDKEGPRVEELRKYDCDVLHISPAHQYPLGHAMRMQKRIELLNWVNERPGRYIIEDDYDSEYVVIGKPIPPMYSIDIRQKVIYLNTFSKSVGPAVKISYMVLPSQLLAQYLKTMSFFKCSVASMEQYALARFISKKHLDRYIHKINRKNSAIREEFLTRLQVLINRNFLTVASGSAGSILLLQLRTRFSDAALRNILLDKGILVSTLSEYYVKNPEKHSGVLVVNYTGLDSAQIRYLIEVLEEVLSNSSHSFNETSVT